MQRLTAAFPDDDEAAIFYGLSLIAHGMSMPTDKTLRVSETGGRDLQPAAENASRSSRHRALPDPLFDYPALAPLALNAAYAYAKIAPSRRTRSICRRTSSSASVCGTKRSIRI